MTSLPCRKCPPTDVELMNAGLFVAYALTLTQHFIDPLTPTIYAGLDAPYLRHGLSIFLLLVAVLQVLACWCDKHSGRLQEQHAWCRRRGLCAFLSYLFWWGVAWVYLDRGINVLSASGSIVFGCGQLWQYLILNSYIRNQRQEIVERNVMHGLTSASI